MDLTHIPMRSRYICCCCFAIGHLLHLIQKNLIHATAQRLIKIGAVCNKTRFSLSLTHSLCIPKSNYFMIVVVVARFRFAHENCLQIGKRSSLRIGKWAWKKKRAHNWIMHGHKRARLRFMALNNTKCSSVFCWFGARSSI